MAATMVVSFTWNESGRSREHWTHAGENPPVGLILCAKKDEAVAHYSMEGLPNKVMAADLPRQG